MAKFGRYEFGKAEPTETYEGDYMALERGFVRIFEGNPDFVGPIATPRLVAAIHLDNGQSVREIKTVEESPAKQKSLTLKTFTGRKFRDP
jgi:hypothetical protein